MGIGDKIADISTYIRGSGLDIILSKSSGLSAVIKTDLEEPIKPLDIIKLSFLRPTTSELNDVTLSLGGDAQEIAALPIILT